MSQKTISQINPLASISPITESLLINFIVTENDSENTAIPVLFNSIADTYVRTDLDGRRNDNYGLQDRMLVGTGRGGGGISYGGADAMRSLLKFDVSSISQPIQRATLQLTVAGYEPGQNPNTSLQVQVHKLLAPWIEGNGEETFPQLVPGAVWVDPADGVAWAGVGDNLDPDAQNNQTQPAFDSSSLATAIFTPAQKPRSSIVEFDITSAVQSWINAPSSNFGILLRDPSNDPQSAFRWVAFGTKEGDLYSYAFTDAVQGPRLVITYATPSSYSNTVYLNGSGWSFDSNPVTPDLLGTWTDNRDEIAVSTSDSYGIQILNGVTANALSGNDSINGQGVVSGISNSGTINTNLGDDRIIGTSTSVGGTGVFAYAGIYNSSGIIGTDSGNDIIDATGYFGLYNSGTISAGFDNDAITGTSTGAVGIYNSGGIIDTSDGNDTITGISSGGNGIYSSGTIYTGSGNDAISGISTGGNVGILTATSSILNTGSGDDTITGTSNINRGIGNGGTIYTGDGNDSIIGISTFISVDNGGTIDTGSGDDSIDALKGGFGGNGSTILGDGNDVVKGFGSGRFDGGDDQDTLLFGSGTYRVSETPDSDGFYTLTSGNTNMLVKNFELIGSASNPANTFSFSSVIGGSFTVGLSNLTVDTLADEDDGDLSPGDVSLREALKFVQSGGTIDFASNLAGGTIVLTLGQLTIDKSVTINGLGADKLTINGNNTSRVFNIDDRTSTTINVVMNGLAITGGSNSSGGGINNSENLIVKDSTIYGNEGSGIYISSNGSVTLNGLSSIYGNKGSGVFIRSDGSVTLNGFSSIHNNTAGEGGGIFNYNNEGEGSIVLNDSSSIYGNTAGIGGGINSRIRGSVTLNGLSSIHNNTASRGGGVFGNFITLNNSSSIYGNTVSENGGGIYGGFITLNDSSSIYGNTASSNGGGIYTGKTSPGTPTGLLSLNDSSSIYGNTATGSGGGVSNGGTLTLNNFSSISGNTAHYDSGGGIFNRGTLTLNDFSSISGNTAGYYGGGVVNYGTVSLTSSSITGNTANYYGGGIVNYGTISLTSSSITGNTAKEYGGGIVNYGGGNNFIGKAEIYSTTISGNSASKDGGGVYNVGNLLVNGSTITQNTAASGLAGDGGGIYNTGIATITNTIVAGNQNKATSLTSDIVGNFVSNGYNLVGNGSGGTGFTNGVNGDKVGTPTSLINPRLAPLANYGGPTKTHALLPGSPALNAANPATSTNLIANGDFEAGNTGFSSQYPYQQDTAQSYRIGTDPKLWNGAWTSFGDHTSGAGNMMLVDGNTSGPLVVWQETVPVSPNVNYNFSSWIASSYPESPAQLIFRINGEQIDSTFTAPSSPGQWTPFSATWNSGSNTSATLTIVDQNLAFGGNDFALDDISFSSTGNLPGADQRGISRPQGTAPDIGAYEFDSAHDKLGTAGMDTLIGTDGNDVFVGFQGRDTITTGSGNDLITYTSIVDAGDIITDFAAGFDIIDLSNLLDSAGFSGVDPIAAGYLGFSANGADTMLTFDTDGFAGSASARPFALVRNVSEVALRNPSNFIF